MATLNLGRIKPVFRDAYSGSTAYVVDDIVTHGDECFICIQAHGAGTQATSQTAYWKKLAAKGTDGTDVGTTITTQGDLLYRDGSGLQRLAKGTASQVLAMNAGATAPEWIAQSGGRTLQMKALYFDDAINYGSATWGDHSHPLGDGTIQITPKTTGNLIEVKFDLHSCGGATWQSAQYRALVSTDSGSSWGYVTSGNSDGGPIAAGATYNETKTVSYTTYFSFWHIAANTNAHQFKIQGFGRTGGGGDHINQNGEAGGQERSRVVITEIDMDGSDFTSGAL